LKARLNIDFTEPHNSGGSNIFNAIDTRLQEFQTPEKISSVFETISAHTGIPVKIKEKNWNGEFIELSVLHSDSLHIFDQLKSFA
jgi:hypothetical protein